MGKLVMLIALCVSLNSQAIERDKAAHFGVSYALQTWGYGFSKKALRLSKTEAIIFSVFTSLIVTTAVEYMPGNQFDGRDILANTLGIGAATGTILMFDF